MDNDNTEVITRVGLLYPAEFRKKRPGTKPKSRRKSFLGVVTNLIFDYFQNSSIHGFKNLVNPNHNLLQRLISGSIILICMILAFKNIATGFYLYQQGLHVTIMKSDSIHVSEIPFPGVAICNLNLIKKSALVALANRMKEKANLSFNETYHTLKYFNRLHRKFKRHAHEKEIELLKYILRVNNQDHNISGLIRELGHSCDDMLNTCRFNFRIVPCKNLFMQGVIPGGQSCCISKNSFIVSDALDADRNWKSKISGLLYGLSVNLNLETSEYLLPQPGLRSYGAEVVIYDPRSHPYKDFGGTVTLAAHKQISLVSIKPLIEINTFKDNWNVCNRSFTYTKHNRHIPYSFQECIFRCILHKTVQPCQCYEYLHSIRDEGSLSECSITGLKCLFDQTKRIFKLQQERMDNVLDDCNCLPACESIMYKYDTTNILQEPFSKFENETHLYVFFETQLVDLFERLPVFNWAKLLANIIGQCSLYLGASITSIAEVIYFATLRLLCDLYSNEQRKKETEKKKKKKKKEKRRLDLEEICAGTKEGKINWNEILAEID